MAKKALEQPVTTNNQPSTTNNQTKDLLPFEPEMVYVEGGTFQMGCTSEQKGCGDNEKPVHSVIVSNFSIGKYEVTQKQWFDIMGTNPSYNKNCDNCPVEKVSWHDVQEYIKKLNAKTGKTYRLPTEAEWEFAARGGNNSRKTQYSGGKTATDIGWLSENSGNKPHPVGTKKANELGIYDMSGNVWEWCEDWYGTYSASTQANPTGANTGSYRVFRGGSWEDYPQYLRVAYRRYTPDYSRYYIGFRLCRTN